MTEPTRRPLSGCAGLTLVELMVVLVFVSIGVLAVAAVQTRSGHAVFATGRDTRALSIGQAQIETARGAGFELARADSGRVEIFDWVTRVDSVDVGLNQVRVDVAWNEAGRRRSLQFNTLLSDR